MEETSDYFSLSDNDKINALEVAASKLGRPADLLEKDIWVVWALNALFDSALGESLVFKGGTSLSKVYQAIDRFSEDVDVTYDIRKIIPDLIDDSDKPYPPNRCGRRRGHLCGCLLRIGDRSRIKWSRFYDERILRPL